MKIFCVMDGRERTDLGHVAYASTSKIDAENFAYTHELYDFSGNANIEILNVTVESEE